jgi:hypothetical protein
MTALGVAFSSRRPLLRRAGWVVLAMLAVAAAAASFQLGRRGVPVPAYSHEDFTARFAPLARQIKQRFDRAMWEISFRQLPCLAEYRLRHPTDRVASGGIGLRFASRGRVVRVVDSMPMGGNVDEPLARCMASAWSWTAARYPAPELADQSFWVRFRVNMKLARSYPPVPSDWRSPARWGPDAYPCAWSDIAARRVRRKGAYLTQSLPGPVCTRARPLDLIDEAPLLADVLYQHVFSPEAADRNGAVSCAWAGDGRPLPEQEQVELFIRSAGGDVQIQPTALAQQRGNPRLLECLADKIGFPGRQLSVPGEREIHLVVTWPVAIASAGGTTAAP